MKLSPLVRNVPFLMILGLSICLIWPGLPQDAIHESISSESGQSRFSGWNTHHLTSPTDPVNSLHKTTAVRWSAAGWNLQVSEDSAASEESAVKIGQIFLIIVSYFVVILIIGLYHRYRNKTRINQDLEEANLKIQRQKEELDAALARMQEIAREDQLTGLANRRAIIEEVEREASRAERTGNPFTLIMIDVDDFKTFNDTYGHDCGDYVLRNCAVLLRQLLREQDRISRWGGDEFVVLLPETDQTGGEQVAEKIRRSISTTPLQFENENLQIEISVGVAEFQPGTDLDTCLKRADSEMYKRKRKNKLSVREQ